MTYDLVIGMKKWTGGYWITAKPKWGDLKDLTFEGPDPSRVVLVEAIDDTLTVENELPGAPPVVVTSRRLYYVTAVSDRVVFEAHVQPANQAALDALELGVALGMLRVLPRHRDDTGEMMRVVVKDAQTLDLLEGINVGVNRISVVRNPPPPWPVTGKYDADGHEVYEAAPHAEPLLVWYAGRRETALVPDLGPGDALVLPRASLAALLPWAEPADPGSALDNAVRSMFNPGWSFDFGTPTVVSTPSGRKAFKRLWQAKP